LRLWFGYSVAPSILLLQLVNGLRSDRLLSFVGGVLGVAVLFAAAALTTGVIPQQGVAAIMIAAASAVGVVAAHRRRRALRKFAEQRLLLHYLPAAAVERVEAAGPKAMALGGEQRTVTLLSADLRGF